MPRTVMANPKVVGRQAGGRSTNPKNVASKQRTMQKVAVGTTSVSKEELRARVEKLERANATLRVKNKELRIVAVEAAEQVDALTMQLASNERRAGRQARHEAPAEALETREIVRPGRAKRKVREVLADDNGHDDRELDEDTHVSWASHDQAEA